MTSALTFTILGLALLDSLNPSLFITQFYLLTTNRPLPRILSYIAGVILTNFTAGMLVLAGLQPLLGRLTGQINPAVWRWIELAAGLVLIGVGLWMRQRKTPEPTVQQPRSLRPVHTFLLGIAITLQELSTAAPYLVAIERIAQAQLSIAGNLFALAAYNALYVAPLMIVVGAFLMSGTRLLKYLEGINRAITLWLPRVFKYGCLLGGVVLAVDATLFFAQ